MLDNVDNTSDAEKPISRLTQAALNNRLMKDEPYVQSINAATGNIIVTAGTVGLSAVNNTSDLDKPLSTAAQAALATKVSTTTLTDYKAENTLTFNTKVDKSSLGAVSGVATLDAFKVLSATQIPVIPKEKVPVSQKADSFSSPVTLTFSNDITGAVTIDGATAALTTVTTLKNTGVVAGTYGATTSIPKITVDAKGRISTVVSTPIATATTLVPGIVKLNDTTNSPSVTDAATARSVQVTYQVASQALSSSLKTTQRGTANGVASLDANGRVPIAQLPETGLIVADRLSNPRTIKTTGDANWTVTFNGSVDVTAPISLTTVLTTPGVFGTPTMTPVLKFDSKGRVIKAGSIKSTPAFSDVTGKPTTLSGYGISDTYTKAQVDLLINSAILAASPSGVVMYFASRNAPANWLVCGGQAVDRTVYANLFAVIGTTFGAGNGTTTFNVPDLRGEFIRGWDNSRGVDSGRAFGTFQFDAFSQHSHKVKEGSHLPRWVTDNDIITSGDDYTQVAAYESSTSTVGGSETRPRNLSLLACIKV